MYELAGCSTNQAGRPQSDVNIYTLSGVAHAVLLAEKSSRIKNSQCI